jgi:ABC-2 type transport system ATP-binding protein
MERLLDQAGAMTVLISTHELADVEDVATHVAFLETGQLLFQESMAELTGRMRRVQVVLNQEAHAPLDIPPSWLQVRTMGNVLSFVETRFSQEALDARIATIGARLRNIEVQPISLRSIFTVLARQAQHKAS